MTTTFSQLDGRPSYAEFKCSSYHVVGTLKPIVHFKIEFSFDRGTVPLDHYAIPSYIEPASEMANFMDTVPKGHTAKKQLIDRRYSQFQTLRQLLVYLFPMVVIPPLPEKSIVSTMQTTRQDERTLQDQERHITRFLNTLAQEPSVLFAGVVMNFLTCNNDHLPGLAETYAIVLSHIESSVKKIEELKEHFADEGSTSANSASAAASTTQMIGGFFGSLKKMANGRVSEIEKAAVRKIEGINDVNRCKGVLKVARHKYRALKNAASEFQLALTSARALEAATGQAANALEGHRDFLGKSGMMTEVSSELKVSHKFVYDVSQADAKSKHTDRMYVYVYLPLVYEAQQYKSLADTIEFYLALNTFKQLELGSTRNQTPVPDLKIITPELWKRIEAFPQRHETVLRDIAAHMAKVGLDSCKAQTLLLNEHQQNQRSEVGAQDE